MADGSAPTNGPGNGPDGRWLAVPQATTALGIGAEAVRARVRRRQLRELRDNRSRPLAFVPDGVAEWARQPRPLHGPNWSLNARRASSRWRCCRRSSTA